MVITSQYFAGMLIEGDDHGAQTILLGGLFQVVYQEAMAAMHTIKEADGGYARLGELGMFVNVYDSHVRLYTLFVGL